MAARQADWTRRLVLFLVPVLVLAGLALIIAGFAMARFALSWIGLALVVAATITLVVARPQQVNWARRLGKSCLTIGLLFFVAGLFEGGDAPFSLWLGGSGVVVGCILLAVDAVRSRRNAAVGQQVT
jgi:hypothetical protein